MCIRDRLTAEIKKIAKQPVIMKLTPNVTDIAEIARAAEACLLYTSPGMWIKSLSGAMDCGYAGLDNGKCQ